jgi:hypothetical protein
MTNTARRRASAPRKKKQSGPDDEIIPLIAGWTRTWSPALLIVGAVVLVLAGVTGVRDGGSWGWALLLAVATAAIAIWTWDYLRRLRRHRQGLDRWLYEQSEFPLIDVMSGGEFELYCTRVLPGLGFRNIQWIGGSDDGGADILATDEDDNEVAVQCKRRKRSVGPWAIREISGAVVGGRHANRRPVLMTNAPVTPRGRKAAAEAGVRVIAREELGHAIWQLKVKAHPEAALEGTDAPDSARPAAPRKILPETAVALGVVCCATVTVLVVLIHALVATPRQTAAANRAASPAAPASPAARIARPVPRPSPAEVVRDYYAAISRHDWPSVWRLGGRNLGWGPYATYNGMVAGYKDTIRDVLTALHVSGDTVTGRFLAYQTGNVTRPYQFTFLVRNGVIVSGQAE